MSTGSRVITGDFDGLNNLVKMLGAKLVVKIGIFGQKGRARKEASEKMTKGGTRRPGKTDASVTNAEIGAIHEFGSITRGIPARSFLRMPLHRRAQTLVKRFSVIFRAAAAKGDMKKALTLLGIACENEIQRAFETHGWGTWPPNSPKTIERKGSASPLIDTAQLRRAIDSRVDSPS